MLLAARIAHTTPDPTRTIAHAATVQAWAAVAALVLAGVLIGVTIAYAVFTKRLADRTETMAEATEKLAEQAIEQGEATNRMAEAMMRTADETAKQVRLEQLNRYRPNLEAIRASAMSLLVVGDNSRGRVAARLQGWHEGLVRQVADYPAGIADFLRAAMFFAFEVKDRIEVGSVTATEATRATSNLATEVGKGITQMLRGEEPPTWNLPTYDEMLKIFRGAQAGE